MNRIRSFFAAILMTTLSVSSAGLAASVENIRFTLTPSTKGAGQVQLSVRSGNDRRNNNMSSSFRAADLTGLDHGRLASSGPVAFALIREAGRLDCAGNARASRADGSCRFTANAAFSYMLAARGMVRPSNEEAYGLTMVGANRGLLDALHRAHYPMPSVSDYIAMTAVGVTPRYIADLTSAGYRPDRSSRLIEFAAIGVTPQYLGSLARAGYADLPQEEVVQLAALKIDPDFIRGFERIGFARLPVGRLVELKALGVTPEYVQAVRRSSRGNQPLHKIVELKAIGFEPVVGRR